MTDLEQSLTGPGGPFEIVEVEIRGVTTRVWKTAPGSLLCDIWVASRAHGARLPRLRGRALHLRPGAHPGRQPRPEAHRAVRARPGRP